MNDFASMGYVQSTLRNVGVFTTISIAFLREAVVFRGKNKMYNLTYLVFSFIFIGISMTINFLLMKTIEKLIKKSDKKMKQIIPYLWITRFIFIILIIFITFGIHRFYIRLRT